MKKRIWELDAARGLCVLGMVVVHCVFDMVEQFGLFSWDYPDFYMFVQNWGGVLFLLISGICVTLGRHSIKRGGVVLACGLLVTAVTYGMGVYTGDFGIVIYFGVLHCLGVCMLLWPLFRRMPLWLLGVIGGALALVGLWIVDAPAVGTSWLIPLGWTPMDFVSSDYFPLLPHLGFFLLGAVLGRTVYAKKQSLLPKVSQKNPVVRVLRFFGKHSLWIYLLHQPVLFGLCWLLSMIL